MPNPEPDAAMVIQADDLRWAMLQAFNDRDDKAVSDAELAASILNAAGIKLSDEAEQGRKAAQEKHTARLNEAAPKQADGRAVDELAYREAVALANALWSQWYREDSPNWKPLPDLRGVISQIDNMTTGLSRTAAPPAAMKAGAG